MPLGPDPGRRCWEIRPGWFNDCQSLSSRTLWGWAQGTGLGGWQERRWGGAGDPGGPGREGLRGLLVPKRAETRGPGRRGQQAVGFRELTHSARVPEAPQAGRFPELTLGGGPACQPGGRVCPSPGACALVACRSPREHQHCCSRPCEGQARGCAGAARPCLAPVGSPVRPPRPRPPSPPGTCLLPSSGQKLAPWRKGDSFPHRVRHRVVLAAGRPPGVRGPV